MLERQKVTVEVSFHMARKDEKEHESQRWDT